MMSSTASHSHAQNFIAAHSQSAYYSQLYLASLIRELPLVRLRSPSDCLHSGVSCFKRMDEPRSSELVVYPMEFDCASDAYAQDTIILPVLQPQGQSTNARHYDAWHICPLHALKTHSCGTATAAPPQSEGR
jgi:hypothetical protein